LSGKWRRGVPDEATEHGELIETIERALNKTTTGQRGPAEIPLPAQAAWLGSESWWPKTAWSTSNWPAGCWKKRGFEVVLANNGREAVEAHARGSFDFILMDLQMPEMNG